jgi:hypothetical protein
VVLADLGEGEVTRRWSLAVCCCVTLVALAVLDPHRHHSSAAQSVGALQSVILTERIRSGEVRVTPDHGVAGEFGTWTISYRVGETRVQGGGGLRVQLPDFWHAGPRNSAFRLQATDPRGDHYVSARCSDPAVALRTLVEMEADTPESWVKTLKPSTLTNRMGYYVYVVRVVVLEGDVRPGETISLTYGDRSQGSRGLRAGILASGPEPAVLAVDTDGTGKFRLHVDAPVMFLESALPAEMLLTARSQVALGEKATLQVALLDRYQNAATTFSGTVKIRVVTGHATVADTVQLTRGKGWVESR